VLHYFGSKDQLFATSLELPVNPATIIRRVFDETEGNVGEMVVRTLLTVWDADVGGAQFIAALRSATSDGFVHDTVREFIHNSILSAFADSIEGEDSSLRGSLIATQSRNSPVALAQRSIGTRCPRIGDVESQDLLSGTAAIGLGIGMHVTTCVRNRSHT
jgi:hypothetical protein